jgi:hypothetical protein
MLRDPCLPDQTAAAGFACPWCKYQWPGPPMTGPTYRAMTVEGEIARQTIGEILDCLEPGELFWLAGFMSAAFASPTCHRARPEERP